MVREGDRNTSQDRRRGSDGTWETKQGKSSASTRTAPKFQNSHKPASHAPVEARIPNPPRPLSAAAPAWGQTSPSSSGMHYLKNSGGKAQPSSQGTAASKPSTGGGGASSWAALLGGGGATTPSATTTTPPKDTGNLKNSTATSTGVVTAAEKPQSKPAVEVKQPVATSSPASPKSFSFQRGNGIVLVHEATSVTSPRSPASPAAAVASATASINGVAPNVASLPPLSWAEKAKLAAAAQPPTAAPPRKAVAASPSKQKTSAPQVVNSPKRGERAARSPGVGQGKDQHNKQQQQQQSRGGQRRSSEEGRRQQPENVVKPSSNSQVKPHSKPPSTNKSSAEIDTTQLHVVTKPEPEPPVAIIIEEHGNLSAKNKILPELPSPLANESETIISAPSEQPEAYSSSSPEPSADFKHALDILCSSLASWKLPASDLQSNSNNVVNKNLHQRVQPRGIKNPGNLCFVNAVMQGLIGSSSFCHVLLALRSLKTTTTSRGGKEREQLIDSKTYPVLSAMVSLASEFRPRAAAENITVADTKKSNTSVSSNTTTPTNDATKKKNLVTILGGCPIDSALIMELINQFTPRQGQIREEGHVEQEDAHEFLHFLLDKMDSELIALRKMVKKKTEEEKGGGDLKNKNINFNDDTMQEIAVEDGFDDDGWLVKSGKKSVRQQEVSAGASNEAASVITSLFQGKFATSVACAGAPNSVTVHPFMIVEVPIYDDSIRSISDSIDALTTAEVLEDYKPAAGAFPQNAAKTERFLHVPDVLVLHLMRFQYTGKSAKISKYVAFEPRLAMRSSWMAPGTSDRGAVYDLVATVTHHGKTISRGHYTADVVQPDGNWLRFDDSDVYVVKEQQVLADTPYLLIYERQR